MTIIVFVLLIFLSLIEWIVFFDVILSWTRLIGMNFQPRFIKSITNPLYETVRFYIPTGFSGIDFAPIIIFIAIEMISKFLFFLDPSVVNYFMR